MSDDPRVEAIRSDAEIGRGTCSYIDETKSDQELIAMMNDDCVTDNEHAVEWAKRLEKLWREQERNAGWGGPDESAY